jgi:hypothetical protein
MGFKVYYDTRDRFSGARRSREFDSQSQAQAWASKNSDRQPIVVRVEETVVWHWKVDA